MDAFTGLCVSPGVVPKDSLVINNYNIAGKDINPVTYKGLRVGLDYKFNDDWNMLITQSYQDMSTSGVFYQMPTGSEGQALDQLQVTLFNNGLTTDKFSNTALVVNGKVGAFDMVYAGAYLTRESFQIQDYTNYARGVWGSYYQCTGYSGASVTKCYTPSSTWHDTTHNTNLSQELRFTTPSDWTVTGVGGIFWEQRKLNDDTEWLYKSVPECQPTDPAGTSCFLALDPSATQKFQSALGDMNNPGLRNSSTGFFDDFKRKYTQSAAFLSLDWHITSTVTLTGGTRYYHIQNEMLGANVGSFYCKQYGGQHSGPCTDTALNYPLGTAPYGTSLSAQDPHSDTSSGFKSRANLSWHITPTALVYATWSQGYRPGGFNRGEAQHLPAYNPDGSKGANQWHVPAEYQSDTLTNIEAGWKTTLAGNRLQFNGAIYQEDWKNVQTGIFAPQLGLGNLTVGLNGPEYKVKGIEATLIWRATQGLTVQGAASYNKSELTNSPQLINNIVGSPGYGQPIETTWVAGTEVQVTNVFGVPGDPLANSPKVQANARARYDWSTVSNDWYVQLGAAYQGSSLSSATHVNQYEMPSWTTWDMSAGVSKGPWTMELIAQNLTDVNKSTFTSAAQFIPVEVPQRPRVLGLQFGYKFTGGKD